MEVTRLEPADRPRWTELWTAYLAFYETSLSREIFDYTWMRLMEDAALHGLALRTNGAIMGITHFTFHANAWTLTPVCYLQDLFVDPAARGLGAGRALIEAVAARVRATGGARLYWQTQSDNATARQLYDRLAKTRGFIRYDYPLY